MVKRVKELLMRSDDTFHVIGQQESIAVSYLRVLALISIVTCHFLQALENHWAWVLNIGVQVFFLISGYLYGHKEIKNWPNWYFKRIKRIYIPFITVVIAFTPFYFYVAGLDIHSLGELVCYITCTQWPGGGSFYGFGHLWFVSAILICYLSTPILQSLRRVAPIIVILLTGYGLFEFIVLRYSVPFFEALFIYAMGYFYTNIGRKLKIFSFSFFLVVAMLVTFSISWQQILETHSIYNRLFHIFVGISFSLVFIVCISTIKHIRLIKPVKFLSKYSYQIYLLHHPFILGYFSLISLTQWASLNILIILSVTISSSILLSEVNDFILKKI